jgi:hypothetical protein
LLFVIRSSQDERDKKENSKAWKNTPDKTRLNYEIRQNLTKAENMLKEATKMLPKGNIDQLTK